MYSNSSNIRGSISQQANWVSLVIALADSGSKEDEDNLRYISQLFHNLKKPLLPEVKNLVDAIDAVVANPHPFDGKKICALAKAAFSRLQGAEI